MVMMMVVVGLAVMTCVGEEQNLYWFCFLICILRRKSRYVIAGPLFVLPTYPTRYFYYCPREFYTILS